jgi:hypothetical protein
VLYNLATTATGYPLRMRRWKIMSAVLAVTVAVGTVGLATATATVGACSGTITIGPAEEDEDADDGRIWFPVTLSTPAGCDRVASVRYKTQLLNVWNAAEADDFKTTDAQASWNQSGSGTSTTHVGVELEPDDAIEWNEVFSVRIYDATGAVIPGSPNATGTIIDDEIKSPDCLFCQSGWCGITVALPTAAAQPVTVGYATVDGTARAGEDFAGIPDGRMTIPAGATEGTLTVQVFRNPPGEPDEQFYVVLTNVSPGSTDRGRVEVHIPAS